MKQIKITMQSTITVDINDGSNMPSMNDITNLYHTGDSNINIDNENFFKQIREKFKCVSLEII